MSEQDVETTLSQLQSLSANNLSQASSLLSQAKVQLLRLNALLPTKDTPAKHVALGRRVLETGALISVRERKPENVARYYAQLQPFYAIDNGTLQHTQRSKITGLYLLSLLSQGEYAEFHTVIEGLEVTFGGGGGGGHASPDADAFIQYPLRLMQALMEGSYDKVWGETKGSNVPCEEYGIFSEVLINTIRSEIASCSEQAYASLPIANAKSLLFLDSEGAVLEFARGRGWVAREGRLYFPVQADEAAQSGKDVLAASSQVIENTLGYARKLETIV